MIKTHIDTFIDLIGTQVTINNTPTKILIRMANSSEIKNYLDDIEYMAVIKPTCFITFSTNANITENSSFTLNNRLYTVRKINSIYYKDNIIYKTAIAY